MKIVGLIIIGGSATNHGEQIEPYHSDDITIKNCTFKGTVVAVIAIHNAGDYDCFEGRVVAGADTGIILNDTWNSADYEDEQYIGIAFNAAGLEYFNSCLGDTARIAIISREDYDNSAPDPDTQERILFYGAGGNAPYIYLEYDSSGILRVSGNDNVGNISGVPIANVGKRSGVTP